MLRIDDLLRTIVVSSDGGARPNPSENVGYGVQIIVALDKVIHLSGRISGGETSNNEAEYLGLLVGMRRAVEEKRASWAIVCVTDSELVVKQISGEYKCTKEHLQGYLADIRALMAEHAIRVVHVLRDHNKAADRLSTSVLDPTPTRKRARV